MELQDLTLQQIVERATTDAAFAQEFIAAADLAGKATIATHDEVWVNFVSLFAETPRDLVNLTDANSEGARMIKALLGMVPTSTGHVTETPPSATPQPQPEAAAQPRDAGPSSEGRGGGGEDEGGADPKTS